MTRVKLNRTRAKARVSRNKTRKNIVMKGGENENQKAESQLMDIKECKTVKNIGNKFKGIAIKRSTIILLQILKTIVFKNLRGWRVIYVDYWCRE